MGITLAHRDGSRAVARTSWRAEQRRRAQRCECQSMLLGAHWQPADRVHCLTAGRWTALMHR